MNKSIPTIFKLAVAVIGFAMSLSASAQTDGRHHTGVRPVEQQRAKKMALTTAQGKTAYGLLAFDYSDIYYTDGLVAFPLEGSETLQHVHLFGDATHSVTAGAYADGYYYVARATPDGDLEKAADLVKYDMEADEATTVGTITNFGAYVADMTYDYSTHTMYAIERPGDMTSDLLTINLETGEGTKVADLDRRFFTLACTYAGQLYGISFEGELCKIDKHTGRVVLVGATGLRPTYFQSMDFDHSDETLYWAANIDESTGVGGMARVDTLTGKATLTGPIGDGAEIAGLYIPFSASAPGTPAAVEQFSVTPGEKGASQAVVAWTNPVTTFDGKPLETISAVKVYRDKQLVKTLDNVTPGASMTYTDELPQGTKGAFHTYVVLAANSKGDGADVKARVFVGRDIPADVQNLNLQADGYTTAKLSWTQPEAGANGGYVDQGSLIYKVTRMPGNVVVAGNLKETAFEDKQLATAGKYSYTVQAINADGESKAVSTPQQVFGPVNTMPYMCDFTANDTPDTWTSIDGNGDGYSWMWSETSRGRVMGHQPSNTQQSDDWLLSYYLPIEKGKTYRLEYDMHSYSKDSLEFYLTQNSDTAMKVQQIAAVGVEGSKDFKHYSVLFTAKETGLFNLALHALSPLRADWLELSKIYLHEAEKINLAATTLTGEQQPMADKENVYQVGVDNWGTTEVDVYEVVLKDDAGNKLASRQVDEPLPSGKSAQVEVAWTPTDVAVTKMVAEVVCSGDEVPTDNTSDTLAVNVRPAFDGTVVKIGTESNQKSKSFPFGLYDQHAAAFNLYAASEIGLKAGTISKIAYPYDAIDQYEDVDNVQAKVYMANTDLVTTAGGWPDESELTLVYDGNINIEKQTEGELELTLDTPFNYDGRNLAVVTIVESAKYYPYVYFTQYASVLEGNAAYSWGDYRSTVPFDFTQKGKQNYYGYTSSVILYISSTLGVEKPEAVPATVAYRLFDMQGRQVASGVSNTNGAIDMATVKPGVYVVAYTINGSTHSTKVVVK